MSDEKKTWTLTWGVHSGTFVSRDVGEPKTGLKDRAACMREAIRLQRHFARLRYSIWYAVANSPDGKKEQLFSTPYER